MNTGKKYKPRVTLTPEFLEEFREALERVIAYTLASDMCSVARKTVYNWRERGKAEIERISQIAEEAEASGHPITDAELEPDEAEALYVEFYLMCVAVRAEKAAEKLDALDKYAADRAGDWKALSWRLSRSFPEEFGDQQTIEHKGSGGPAVQIYIPDNGREVDGE